MKHDYLKQRGPGYYVELDVPRPLWAAVGKRRLVRSLKTRDHAVAVSRCYPALAEFNELLRQAAKPKQADDMMAAALGWRETLAALDRGDGSAFWIGSDDPTDQTIESKRWFATNVVEEEADRYESSHGVEATTQFYGIARGTATPLSLYLNEWLLEGGKKAR